MEECREDSLKYVTKCLERAAEFDNPEAIRILFALLIKFYKIKNCEGLWHRFKKYMMSCDSIRLGENYTLQSLSRHLQNFSVAPASIELPIVGPWEIDEPQPTIEEIQDKEKKLNGDQVDIYRRIVTAVQDSSVEKRLFFLQADQESSKILLLNTILDSLACKGVKTTAVTYNAHTALLLRDGVSCYTKFQLELNLNQQSESLLDRESPEGKELSKTQLIIWDEISMVSCHALNAVDRLMQSLKGNAAPFGGVCVLLSGDVKQLLPAAETVKASFEISFVKYTSWTYFEILRLPGKIPYDSVEINYLEYLSNLHNLDKSEFGHIFIINDMYVTDVLDAIYGDATPANVSHRMIFSPKNTNCDEINKKALAKWAHNGHGPPLVFSSFDGNVTEDDIQSLKLKNGRNLHLYNGGVLPFFKTYCTNKLGDSSEFPLKELALKEGAPIRLLINLSYKEGLVNGTRLTVLSATQWLLQAKISVGPRKNKIVFIPRLSLPKDGKFRWQFPVSLCFAMTMNKAPSQTFDLIGIYNAENVNAHGQMYVTLSRVKNFNSVKIESYGHKTPIICQDILNIVSRN